MSLLDVSRLVVSYAGTPVVSELDFSVARGESVALVGESGSGKSQTALAVMGLLPRSARVSGSIRLGGTEVVAAPAAVLNRLRPRRMAMVFQDPSQALNPYLRVGRQLARILEHHGLASGQDARSRVEDMLARVGLPDPHRQFEAWPHELSGGMRQRVMIASALIAEPDLLIADEPTTALDVTVQAQILDLLDELRQETALLLITHDLGVVAGRSERLLVLEQGRLAETGSTREVFAAPGSAGTRALLEAQPRAQRGVTQPATPGREVFAIEAAAVGYSTRRGSPVMAVRDVSLTVSAGETVAIVGESGAGKSSLGRAALGLVAPASGRIVFAGRALAPLAADRAARARRDLQLVFQDPAGSLDPQMTVGAILAEPLGVHERGLSAAERERRADAALAAMGLGPEMADRFPHELSGGQASRIAIARALILEPRVLVCDEAVAALDGRVREEVLGLLGEVQSRTGLAILFITHDLAVARAISHRVLVMYLGRQAELGRTATLFERPLHPYTQALLAAMPRPDPDRPGGRAMIGGEVPSPRHAPPGCAFHPRCPRAEGRCAVERPVTRDIGGVSVACHFASDFLSKAVL